MPYQLHNISQRVSPNGRKKCQVLNKMTHTPSAIVSIVYSKWGCYSWLWTWAQPWDVQLLLCFHIWGIDDPTQNRTKFFVHGIFLHCWEIYPCQFSRSRYYLGCFRASLLRACEDTAAQRSRAHLSPTAGYGTRHNATHHVLHPAESTCTLQRRVQNADSLPRRGGKVSETGFLGVRFWLPWHQVLVLIPP
jgi:hypothetical protein